MLLQLSQNVSLTNHTNPLNLAHPTASLTKASSAATLHDETAAVPLQATTRPRQASSAATRHDETAAVPLQATARPRQASSAATGHNETVAGYKFSRTLLQASRSTNVLQMRRGASVGWIVFDAFLVVFIAGILACCLVSFSNVVWGNQQQHKAAAVLGASRPQDSKKPGTSQSLMATAVPPPVLCPELILINSESRFRIQMQDLVDENTDYFPILSPSGTTHFEAKIEEGRVLYLYSPGQDTARIMVQSPRSFDIQMMNILDGQGRWFGKVEAMPNGGGLLLFHKNKPSVVIRVQDIATYSMIAEPIVGGGKIATLSSSKSGQTGDCLRCQVKNGIDPVLCLGVFLALIALKPSLLELGMASTARSTTRSVS